MNAPSQPTREAFEDESSSAEIKQFLLDLYKRRLVILAAVVLGIALSAAYLARQPKIYTAVAIVEYDPTPPRPLGSEVEAVDDPVESFWMSQEFYETQNRILASRTVAERTVVRLGLHRDLRFLFGERPPPNARPVSVLAAAEKLRSRTKVELVRGTRLVNVKVDDTDPARAARIANGIVASYLEKTVEDRTSSTLGALDWLRGQLGTVQGQLESSELALHDFKQQNNILSVSLEDRQNMITNQLEGLTASMTETRRRRVELGSRVRALRAAIAADPMSAHAMAIDENPEVVELRSRYRTRTAECEALATRYGAEHPDMQACAREITSIRDSMRATISGILDAAQSTLREVEGVESGLATELERVNHAGLELNLREIEYQRLLRERETNAKLFGVLLDRTAETNVTRFLRVAFMRVVDEANPPGAPSAPRKTLGVALGALIGLAIGLLLAILLRFFDRTLHGTEELSALGLGVLGVVPDVGGRRRRGFRRKTEEQPKVGLELLRNPRSPFAESFRSIRTSLAFLGAAKGVRTLLVASAGPGDGKTTVSVNLCAALAQNQLNVLLIDTDLRRPNVHRSLGIENDRGVSSVLIGDATLEACVVHLEDGGFDVLTCGPIPPNPSELIDADGFDRLVAHALARYDRVVFDSPPVGVVADAMILARHADVAVIVTRPGWTPRDLLKQCVQKLRAANAHVAGAIVNAVRTDDLTYGGAAYYYGRSDYYGSDAKRGN